MNFKNIIKKSPILVLVFILGACNLLDVQPKNSLTKDKAFEDVIDYSNLLSPIYKSLRSNSFYYNLLPDIMSDNLKDVRSYGNWSQFVNWDYDASNSKINSIFSSGYYIILQTNLIILNIEDKRKDNLDEKSAKLEEMVLNRVKGQAHAVRAYAYFNLLRYFSQSYLRTSTALGVPITETDASEIIEEAPRKTVKECYDYIYADLAKAEAYLSAELDKPINSATNKRRMDLDAVFALRARISLYSGLYEDALKYSTLLIDKGNVEGSSIKLAGFSEYTKVFTDDKNLGYEVIFSLGYDSGNPGSAPGDPSSSFAISKGLKDIYSKKDTRTLVVKQNKQGLLAKYEGRDGKTDGIVDVKVFRMSEMYLIRAEAYQKSGNDALAMEDLRTIRAARLKDYDGATDLAVTGFELEDAILVENRKEFALEGHRFFDARRAEIEFSRKGSDCTGNTYNCDLAAGSYKFLFPIPAREIEVNPAISQAQQNPGY